MLMVVDIYCYFFVVQIDWVVEEGYISLVGFNFYVCKIILIVLWCWCKILFLVVMCVEIGVFWWELQVECYDFVFDIQGLFKISVVMCMVCLVLQGCCIGLVNVIEGLGYELIFCIFYDQSILVGLCMYVVMCVRLVVVVVLGYQLEGQFDFVLQLLEFVCWVWMLEQLYVVFFYGIVCVVKQWLQVQWIKLGQVLVECGL